MSDSRAVLIQAAAVALRASGVPQPERDARLLMRWASGLDGAALSAREAEPAPEDEAERFRDAARRRGNREPLSHITGERLFWGRPFQVSAAVLDPRPETEVLIGEALHRGPFRRILDLGTGSGCILLTLLAEWPGAEGTGTDLSPDALEVAKRNAQALNVTERCELVRADWTDGVNGEFDLIASNPPYLAKAEMSALSPEVQHEPHAALTPGGDGLAAYRAIAEGAGRLLAPGGLLMVEIGPTQSMEVAAILAASGWSVAQIVPDLDQRARVVTARR